jgi:hypothetical protein
VEPGPDLQYAQTSDGVTNACQVLGDGPALVWLPSPGNRRAQGGSRARRGLRAPRPLVVAVYAPGRVAIGVHEMEQC